MPLLGPHLGFSLLTLLPQRIGGSETYVRSLLREFAAGRGPQHVTVLANGAVMAAYRDLHGGSVSLHHVPSYSVADKSVPRGRAMASARLRPRRLARDLPPGLEAVHYPLTVPIPRVHQPSVVTLHDLQHLELPGMFSRLERRYRRWAYDGSARAATLVITPTEHARRTAVERLDLEPDRVEAVPSGIDRARFREECADDEAELLARFALPERFLIYPANLWPHKNHELLIEALAAVEHLNVHLLLTGQPYDRLSGLLARAQRLGIGARVRHLGFVSERSMPALYRRATAMIFPSLYEGFGFPPLEAMACGCPVAASNRGSLAEVCGDAALLLDPGDPRSIASAIESIVADARLRARLRKRGLARARYFSWPASAERHREIYARVADL